MTEETDKQLWERRQGESSKAFEAFVQYRDMPAPRSIRRLAQTLGKSETLIAGWSSKNDWVKRVEAWEDELDHIARQAHIDEIKKMRKRHAKLAGDMLVKAAAALECMSEEEIRASDISRMVETASKLERISMGDVGDVVEERDGGMAAPAVTFYLPDNGRDKTDEEIET